MKIKYLLGMASGLLALTALGGCLGGDDPKDGSSSFSISLAADVDSIETPVADSGKPGVLSTTRTTYSCTEDGEVNEDEGPDNYNYAITGGFLYLWQGSSCTAMKFSGTASKIQGEWTSTDLSARIPSKYRTSSICDTATLEDNQYETILKNPVVTYTITSSKVKGTVKGQFCYGAALAAAIEDKEDLKLVSSDCSTVKVMNEDVEKTATITVTFKDNKMEQTVKYNGKTCKATVPLYLGSEEPKCSEEEQEDMAEQIEEFQDCLEDSDFNDDINMASKTSSEFRSPLERALRISLPL